MKTTFKIAWLELKTLFSSPIAWLLLIIFTVQAVLGFTDLLKTAIVDQGRQFLDFINFKAFVTERIFGISPKMENSFLGEIIGRWYLYIPLLTMGLISRELNSGNIKLLFSSPVKIREIVLGKFIGIMLYWTLLMVMLLVFVFCGYIFIDGLDLPLVFSCLLGVYLSAMLYSAIGLFVSCLTTYAIVAAISTFVVLATLEYFGSLWHGVPFIRDLTWFINTGAHTRNFLRGLIISRDLAYFVFLTATFLGLSGMVLESMVHFRSFTIKLTRYLLLIAGMLLLGYAVSRPKLTLYWDVTAFKSNTLSPATQQVLKQLKGPVKVTLFDNLFVNVGDLGKPENVNLNIQRWEPYKRFLPELELDYVHFYDAAGDGSYPGAPDVTIQAAAAVSAKEQKVDLKDYRPPAEIRKLVDLSAYDHQTVMRISNGNKEVFLRKPSYISGYKSEEYVVANLKRMLSGADTLAFLSNNNERSIENDGESDYKSSVLGGKSNNSPLRDKGFEAFSFVPDQPIPKRTSVLVIADPGIPYSTGNLKNIREYIDAGGNVLIAKGQNDVSILEALTKPLGVEFMQGSLVQPNKKGSANHIKVILNATALQDTTYALQEWNAIRLTDATALKYKPDGTFKIAPVLMTDAKTTWNKMLESTLDTGQLAFHPEQGDVHTALPVALALTRLIKDKEQRIMVVGNADFMTPRGDIIFTNAIFRWFSYGKFPLDKLRKDLPDDVVKLTYRQADILKYWLIIGICGFLAVFGAVYLLKRKSL